MMAKPLPGDMPYIKPGDENSKFYNKPDEAPISHPAEILERLKKEKPDVPVPELIVEADAIVAEEIKERQKQRLLALDKEDTERKKKEDDEKTVEATETQERWT